ncbi:afadin- and alpha-actinin-binding protein-like [Camponotus floridanus]|uniref:afadin- and alpha-actinin-binding protein-like n=1 Tax=Camponotus floridanus TaxID=104421 RepID=UPI00059D6DCB|nr:afadin- and alpha-actinin-binding protein-like [Camponotus floridanus]XP_025264803.1 afadin- and alpha-actinin-binding protein-like [Camponotus floridanus]XP_025264804.1 afadin- and alpha-actinin-binding protein-like [Camponotus floridanus]XP_025264805.1 afadin- and alpha-actinin-binding protein-like [Camponotus floridanus]
MSTNFNNTCPKRDLRSIFAKGSNFNSEEPVFCTEDNLEQSLYIINEEFESFGISPLSKHNDQKSSDPFKKLLIKVINATWSLIHKYRSLMRLHDNSAESNHRIVNDNFNLKNHVKRLKEDVQKKEQALCEAQERERRLKVQCESVSRDLKHEKEEIRKLKKQAQSKDIQHEHEIRRIMRNSEKLQEQLQKSLGTFVSKDKVLQMMQTDHEKELTSYKQTICRLEENNRQMLEEINNLKQILELHKNAIDLQVEASGWTSTNI